MERKRFKDRFQRKNKGLLTAGTLPHESEKCYIFTYSQKDPK